MSWSLKIGRLFGIEVYLHFTFLLVLGLIGFQHWQTDRSVVSVLLGTVFFLSVFGCILLHELGHALTARRYGIATQDITLLPIGGVARLERMPDRPAQELWVALAGPAVNVGISALLAAGLLVTDSFESPERLSVTQGGFVERLLMVNLFIVAFNLLPAFPMDGGRVLRALLAMKMDYALATARAAKLGQGIAILFGIVGLLWNPFLVFIALFVWIGASQEASQAALKSVLAGIPVSRAMLTEFHSVSPTDTLTRVVELVLAGSQTDFPVAESGRVCGVLTRQDLMVALAQKGASATVAEVMRREFVELHPEEMLEEVLNRHRPTGLPLLPVTADGHLVGLLTIENIHEFVMVRSALNQPHGSRR